MTVVPSQYQIYSTTQEAWGALRTAIEGARTSIYWELYIFVDDAVGTHFFDLLEKKAREECDVKLIVDQLGSFRISHKRIHSLRSSGVDLIFFHERRHPYRTIWRRLWSRTHRKILVVDEMFGFVGGVNIDATMRDWDDLQIRIEGRAVHSLLRAFAKNYWIAGGDKKRVEHLWKYSFRVARDLHDIEFIYDDPTVSRSRSRKKYTEALLKARERVILFSPYYFPDKKFLQALWSARKRGIRVDLLIPFRTDLRLVTYAAYAWFAVMYRYGVRLHFLKRMMHGKGVIMDDTWAMIGTSNIEQTSFYDNYEVNVALKDPDVVSRLKETAERWIRSAKQMTPLEWEGRGWYHRVKERVALFLYRIWHHR